MKIGIISDTHNYLDPQIFPHFQDVDHIVHAGDIGDLEIITALEKFAPVTAVKGNTDGFPITHRFPEEQILDLGDKCFFVRHIVPQPEYLSQVDWNYFHSLNPDVIIFGHTHTPFTKKSREKLFFNPGSAGQGRGAPRSIGFITINRDMIQHKILPLE